VAPTTTPTLATSRIVRNRATREPMPELRKFTASFATPTKMSKTAKSAMNASMTTKIGSMKSFQATQGPETYPDPAQ
jgi:hypothetical protein